MTTQLDLGSLRNALVSLEESIALVRNSAWFTQQSEALQNTIIAGVIQNFEFVYELSIKMIRRQLELEAASPTEVDEGNFRDLMRVAGEKGLVGDVEAWFGYRRMRNITAHTYDHAKAWQVYEGSLSFVDDAQALLDALARRHTTNPLSLAQGAALADAFTESDLPWRVDIVDWATTDDPFRTIIARDKVVVQEARS